mgnify:CR=1 FL=1
MVAIVEAQFGDHISAFGWDAALDRETSIGSAVVVDGFGVCANGASQQETGNDVAHIAGCDDVKVYTLLYIYNKNDALSKLCVSLKYSVLLFV